MPDYKHIAVHEDVKAQLEEQKPNGVTWTHYLKEKLIEDE